MTEGRQADYLACLEQLWKWQLRWALQKHLIKELSANIGIMKAIGLVDDLMLRLIFIVGT
jgi:hypothetical protein